MVQNRCSVKCYSKWRQCIIINIYIWCFGVSETSVEFNNKCSKLPQSSDFLEIRTEHNSNAQEHITIEWWEQLSGGGGGGINIMLDWLKPGIKLRQYTRLQGVIFIIFKLTVQKEAKKYLFIEDRINVQTNLLWFIIQRC